ncbi:ankyrin repeat domain-containing protein [bacterium]|nr:ankyrin repeat domain-containing protein [bacterium]MBU1884878.1 ankyrin repeat domain-containing protein [bacterium]
MKKYLFFASFIAFSIFFGGCAAKSNYNAGTNEQIAKQVVAQGKVNVLDDKGFSPLHYAADNNRLDIVKYLVENGALIDAKASTGTTALIFTSDGKEPANLDIVKYLLIKGADINAKENSGHTPLSAALYAKNKDTAKFLIDKGADLETRGYNGWTPFLYASYYGVTDIVKYLVEKKVDINARSLTGETALILAAWDAKPDTVEYLLSIGMDAQAKNNLGESALDKVKNRQIYWRRIGSQQGNIYLKDFAKVALLLEEASNLGAKETRLAFEKAKEKNTIIAYEDFAALYPTSYLAKEALALAAKKREEKRNDPTAQKKILDNVLAYLNKKDIDGLLNYANSNPEVMDFAQNEPKIYLLFTGPKELQVGKILQFKEQGISDGVLSSKIKSLNKPYRKFSLEEIKTLMDLGCTDAILIAMLDVTTEYEKENRQLKANEELLKSQEKIAKENKSNTTIYQGTNVQQQQTIGDKIIEKATEQAIDSLIKNLF